MNIYYIGGSPCAGKSSVAEILSRRYGLYYFKVDDFLDRYMQAGARRGCPVCRKAADLKRIDWKSGIITEGAAYLPELMKQSGIPDSRYISITPTKEFQISHYRKRDFVAWVLEGCSDKETAFLNWMDRDILFAQEVRRQCHNENYVSVVNDGNMDLDELAGLVAAHFGLK